MSGFHLSYFCLLALFSKVEVTYIMLMVDLVVQSEKVTGNKIPFVHELFPSAHFKLVYFCSGLTAGS